MRAKDPATLMTVSDEDIVRLYITREHLKHHVRRVTLGAQETFRLIHLAIEELKGPAGLDESGVSLFKTPEAIDEMWAGQQRHLECIQDPPDMNMYRVARTTTINNVDLPYYKCLRGSNSLEGFHKALPNMIPVALHGGTLTGAGMPCLVAKDGTTGPIRAPLIDRLNARCQQLFGETVEENFRAPADVSSNELLGLEYLFSQSTGESGPFSLQDIVNDGPGQKRRCSDLGSLIQMTQTRRTRAMWRHTTVRWMPSCPTSHSPATKPPLFTLRPLRMPAVQTLFLAFLSWKCSALCWWRLAWQKKSCHSPPEQRNQVLKAWNAVEEHDKQPQKFNQLYRTHWGNTLYCRTKRDDLVDAALIQRVKMAKRYAPAQQDISAQHNRLMYTLAYERVQHRILVEDPVLCKAGIPLPKINSKTVQDFIRRQERLLNLHATKQPSTITKTTSISSADLPPAPHQPAVLPPPDYPLMEYVPTPSTAGTQGVKGRTDMMAPLSPGLSHRCHICYCHHQ
ncbi:hypothetical protein J4Q44_G00197070 [Coregonus suidteri]|uniref:Uncharacterized protein n=1 Tax=Coregonus suidteri TaxID=861788 RepID=A0AAN8LXT1_9TELE